MYEFLIHMLIFYTYVDVDCWRTVWKQFARNIYIVKAGNLLEGGVFSHYEEKVDLKKVTLCKKDLPGFDVGRGQ